MEVSLSDSISVVKARLSPHTRLGVHSQGLTISRGENSPILRLNNLNKSLAEYGVSSSDVLTVKDLGPQIGYRTVFVVEYAGPILIMAAYAARFDLIYGAAASSATWSPVATWGVMAWIAHFVKREIETFFIHKFSRPTMPLTNLWKNSVYYWGFALAVGYPLCSPLYTPPASMLQVAIGAGIMAIAELVNLAVHIQLSSMRPSEGSDARTVPEGPLFALVSCPNYTAEVLSWVGFCIMTQIGLAYAFTLVGLLQMTQWALQKHKGYKESDPTFKARGRKAIIPFII